MSKSTTVKATGENEFVDTPDLDKLRPASEQRILKNKKLAKFEKAIPSKRPVKVKPKVEKISVPCYRCNNSEMVTPDQFNMAESYQHVCKRCRRR